MILIEHNGERQLVNSLDGYPGAIVIADNVPMPPSGFCTWSGGKWIEDAAAKAAALERARIEGMSKAELIEEAVRRARASP